MKHEVHIDYRGQTKLVGWCYYTMKNTNSTSVFAYSDEWLDFQDKFAIDPGDLNLSEGRLYSKSPKSALPGILQDAAPDRWGIHLINRASRKMGENRTLSEIDYLLAVNDQSRIGALRLKREGEKDFGHSIGKFKIPPLIQLSTLLNASFAVESENETVEDLQLLLNEGSTLGGARPKSSVIDSNGCLAIAKIPRKEEDRSVTHGEVFAIKLA